MPSVCPPDNIGIGFGNEYQVWQLLLIESVCIFIDSSGMDFAHVSLSHVDPITCVTQ